MGMLIVVFPHSCFIIYLPPAIDTAFFALRAQSNDPQVGQNKDDSVTAIARHRKSRRPRSMVHSRDDRNQKSMLGIRVPRSCRTLGRICFS